MHWRTLQRLTFRLQRNEMTDKILESLEIGMHYAMLCRAAEHAEAIEDAIELYKAQNTSDILCEVRARLRSAPRRQFECAPNIYSSWLCQGSVLDILDAAILKSEQNLNKVVK
jgi:hypothetical protein